MEEPGEDAHTIMEEGESLFCETFREVFLGEGGTQDRKSLLVGVQRSFDSTYLLRQWVEVWDYAGDLKFPWLHRRAAGTTWVLCFHRGYIIGTRVEGWVRVSLPFPGPRLAPANGWTV